MSKLTEVDAATLIYALEYGDIFWAKNDDGDYEERRVVDTFWPQGHPSSVSSVVVGGDENDVSKHQESDLFERQAVNSMEGGPNVVRKPLPEGIKFIERLSKCGEWNGPEPVGTVMMYDTTKGEIKDEWVVMDGVANIGGSGKDWSGW